MTDRLPFAAEHSIPDRTRVDACRRGPEGGPRLLFLSGGSAMRGACRELKRGTHNSVHLITPFDSGGSSGVLQAAFGMVSVGDLRSRLLALADEDVPGSGALSAVFTLRLDAAEHQDALLAELADLVDGTHPLVVALTESVRLVVQEHLAWFRQRMPGSFDLRGASVGNLILAGGYLEHDRQLEPVLANMSALLSTRGLVRPVSEVPLQLCADLVDGSRLVGQHRITGKTEPPITAPIRSLSLVDDRGREVPVEGRPAAPGVAERIAEAAQVCYPLGSFWTSVVANLLPAGVGRAICRSAARKVLVPNAGRDPELLGMGIHDCVDVLRDVVAADVGSEVGVLDVVDRVVLDTRGIDYQGRLQVEALAGRGVEIVDIPLAAGVDPSTLDPVSLTDVLLSLT